MAVLLYKASISKFFLYFYCLIKIILIIKIPMNMVHYADPKTLSLTGRP